MRPDPIRVRHAVVLASVVGLEKASRQVGVSQSRICEWRRQIERETGETFPRRFDLRRYPRKHKLTDRQKAELRARRKRGVSWGVLARIYRVSVGTCRRACGEPAMARRS